jgi:hypothetical protein
MSFNLGKAKVTNAADEHVKELGGGGTITLRTRRHPDYKTRRDAAAFKIYGTRKLTPERLRQMAETTNKLVAGHCILGWEDVVDGDGAPFPYSKDNAVMLMTSPEYEPFQEHVLGLLQEVDDSYAAFEDDVTGN